MRDFATFLRELRRRKVFRVAGVYVVCAFGVLQAADLAVEPLGLPSWTMSLLWLLILAAFPIALVLAWAFEVTPDGVKLAELRGSGDDGGAIAGRTESSPTVSRRPALLVFGVGVLVSLLAFGAYAALSGDGDGGDDPSSLSASSDPLAERSIAVLPLENLSPDEENAFFAAGIHEEILTQLSKVGDLRVVSRTSVAPYADTEASVREIGERLGVRAIVEGSVQRAGNRVRVSAQLIDARTDEHLWAERYDRQLDDVFAIQSEIALAIAEALHARLTAGERQRIERRPTENLAAYELYLRALELYARGRDENETAIELLRQATELDPSFAHAYALMASGYMQRVQTYGFPRVWADSGLALARRAVELAPDLAHGHQAMGSNYHLLGRYSEADAALRRAVELNPSSATVLVNLSVAELARGRYDESIRWAAQAVPLDPRSPYPALHLAHDYWMLGLDAESRRWLERTLELEPEFPFAHEFAVARDLFGGDPEAALRRADAALEREPGDHHRLMVAADAALFTGRYEVAARRFERLVERVPDGRHHLFGRSFRARLAFARLRTGDVAAADTLFDAALELARADLARGSEAPGLPAEIAGIHAIRGDHEEAYRWLDRAYEAGWRQLPLLTGDPFFESLQGTARFERYKDRIRQDLAAMRRRVEERGQDVLRL